MCIASRKTGGRFTEKFFEYPGQVNDAMAFMRTKTMVENVYFCPQLLVEKKRVKSNVDLVQCVWADLDDCPPNRLLVHPSIALQTSPGRYQAIWTLAEPVAGEDAEAIARRVAYGHSQEGSDRSGWDLTQLLRIPGTLNFKYMDGGEVPQVEVLEWNQTAFTLADFKGYPQVEGYEYLDIPFPDYVPEEGEKILERFRFRINGAAFTIFHREPERDRSAVLFRLEMFCFEAGMSMAETFQVCRDSMCNKFANDEVRLWKDVCRARSRFDENRKVQTLPPSGELPILSDAEKRIVGQLPPTFIDRYAEWAKTVGDAAEQYHVATAFVVLSSLLAGSLRIPTSFGVILPNLWFLILADTTLTRKSTAMELGVDLAMEIDDSILMATDGSLEGLMTALQTRAGMPSVFLRDEFTGLVEQMHKKDYMSGLPEFFAKIYDGKMMKRLLRKEEITIRDPRLIVFGGGIKSKMTRILNYEHVESGFLPRFIIVTANSDITKVKPLGPPVETSMRGRSELIAELRTVSQRHSGIVPLLNNGKVVGTTRQPTDVTMTQEAWGRYNELDQTLMQIAIDSGELAEVLVPMNARLSINILKCAMLIAASRSEGPEVEISYYDLIKAASYADDWRRYAQEIVVNVGRSDLEHKIDVVLKAIQKRGSLPRSRIMQTYHILSREMDEIEKTLIGRGLVTRGGEGRAVTYNSLLDLRKRNSMSRNGVAVVSGGLDSVTMLYDGLFNLGWRPTVVSFNYGQRHVKEVDAAHDICKLLGLTHHEVDLADYGKMLSHSNSALVDPDAKVPEGRYDGENMKSTVVPNRNMTMLSLATGICIAEKGSFVATAVHAGDHAIYPDCRPDFIGAFAQTVRLANEGFLAEDFGILAPFVYKTKTDIARLAAELGVPFHKTWSCYVGKDVHCGRCGTCVERLEAIHDAGAASLDETVYKDRDYWKEALGR